MAHEKNHDYHILNPSLWPLLGAIAGFVMLFGAVLFFHDSGPWVLLAGFVGVLYVMFGWWSDTVTENQIGDHPVYHVRSHVLFRVVLEFFQTCHVPDGRNEPH